MLRTTAADAEVLVRLLETHRAMFDLQRKVLMFGIDALDAGGGEQVRMSARRA